MTEPIQGALAIARAVALCRPRAVCAYPATPPPRIVDELAAMADDGSLSGCRIAHTEGAHAALWFALGAAASGARAYTAANGENLLRMAEAAYETAALRSPVVMTVVHRALGAPTDACSDHSDSLAVRDAGWIQLYARSCQEAVDLHVQAFSLAESLSCPVMVCLDAPLADGTWNIDLPSQAGVDGFLPPSEPRCALDCLEPATIGARADPDAFTEARYLSHHRELRALALIPHVAQRFRKAFGRDAGGLVRSRGDDAETVVVAMGSIDATLGEAVDAMRERGVRAGAVSIAAFRPFPLAALRAALQGAKRVVVLERSFAPGLGGIVCDGVRKCLAGAATRTYTAVAGLGGRTVTTASLMRLIEDAANDELEQLTFVDLDAGRVCGELEREAAHDQRTTAARAAPAGARDAPPRSA